MSGVAVSGIVGRDGEVERLRASLSQVAAGRGGVVWVGGEPGIGKSALVDEAVAGAAAAGVRVFRGAGDELTQSFALRLMADCLGVYRRPADEFRQEITDLLAGRAGGVDPVRAAGEQMVGLVARECARAPVLLVGDDLQWADEASLAVWHRLAQLVGQEPLLLVGVCRPVPQRVEVDRVHQAVAQVADAVLVELGPLRPDEVATMAAALLSAPPGPGLRTGLDQAGGNPLYVREMLDALVGDGQVSVVGGVAEVAGRVHPIVSSLSAAIGHRLGFLSEPALSALQAAAVLGVRFTTGELALVTGQPAPQLADIVAEAVAAGVLAEAGEELMFRHALIRQALHEQMPTAVRIGLHAHMARVLADAAATSWDRVAQHLIAAPGAIDDWALTWLANLPPAALYAMPATAAELLQRARQISLPGDPRRAAFTTRLSTTLGLLGRTEELVALCEEGLTTVTDPHLLGEIARNLSTGYHDAGRSDDGQKMITRVLDGPNPGAPWRGRLQARRAMHLISSGQTEQAVEQAHLALAEGERERDPVTIGSALNVILMQAPNEIDALEIVERGLRVLVGEDFRSMDLRLMFLTNRLVLLINLDRTTEFEAALGPTIALAESQGSKRLIFMHITAAAHHMEHGDWDQAVLHLDQVADVPTLPQDSLIKNGYAALIAIHRGDRATAERHITAVANIPYLSGVLFLISAGPLTVAKALLAEAQGELTTAVQILAVWLDPSVAGNAYARTQSARYLPDLVRLALAADDRVTAQAAVAAVEADTQADANLTLRAGMCRAMLEDDPAALIAAADHYDRVGRLPEAAFALQEGAVRLAMRGDTAAARTAFERAVSIYENLGAFVDLRRMQARLRPHGIRLGSHAAHRRATTGWDALTAAERAVAALVAEGHSNPDIATRMYLSRRTIEAHVAHTMTKLQVRSRVDIARELTRHNQPESAAIPSQP